MKTTIILFAMAFAMVNFSFSQGLVAHYPLDGNGNDISGNGLNGEIEGDVTPTEGYNGVPGKAMNFSGVEQKITVSEVSNFDFGDRGSATVAAWFRTSSTKSYCGIVHTGTDGWAKGMLLGLNWQMGKIIFGVGAEGMLNSSNCIGMLSEESYNDGLWHHVVATVDPANNKATLYVDGVISRLGHYDNFGNVGGELIEDNTVQNLDGINYSFTPSSAVLTIGNTPATYLGQHFEGDIDEIFIFTEVLDANQIFNLYNTGVVSGISKLEKEMDFTIFPNPTSEFITISKLPLNTSISIFDNQGREVLTTLSKSPSETISVSSLSKGTYTVLTQYKDVVVTKSFIVK